MTAMKSITIETYEMHIDCGNPIRVEGSRWSETVNISSSIDVTVRKYLASGDYSDGGEDRVVIVDVDGKRYGEFSAPQIRAFRNI